MKNLVAGMHWAEVRGGSSQIDTCITQILKLRSRITFFLLLSNEREHVCEIKLQNVTLQIFPMNTVEWYAIDNHTLGGEKNKITPCLC